MCIIVLVLHIYSNAGNTEDELLSQRLPGSIPEVQGNMPLESQSQSSQEMIPLMEIRKCEIETAGMFILFFTKNNKVETSSRSVNFEMFFLVSSNRQKSTKFL